MAACSSREGASIERYNRRRGCHFRPLLPPMPELAVLVCAPRDQRGLRLAGEHFIFRRVTPLWPFGI
jgi:hypothetical protein